MAWHESYLKTNGGRIRVDYNVTLFDQTVTTWVDSLTYTATQDCFVNVIVKGDGYSAPLVYVNGVIIRFFIDSDNYEHETTLILKKGDTISKRISSDTGSIYYRFVVYPIYYDNGGHDYSTTEQVVGTWIDGKPIYEKSYPITNANISTGWNILINNVSDIDTFVSGECALSGSSYGYSWEASYHHNGDIAIYNFLGGDIPSANGYVTIQYTKSSS